MVVVGCYWSCCYGGSVVMVFGVMGRSCGCGDRWFVVHDKVPVEEGWGRQYCWL
jgi:hypothetical protein